MADRPSVLLIGNNGAGKSTVGRALRIVQMIARGSSRIDDLVRPKDLARGRSDVPMRVEIEATLGNHTFQYSIAFDFHKWGQVPYDAGFVLVRDGVLHRDTFAAPAAYLKREARGMAAGSPWPCDFGPDLSRSFRALKTWFTIKVYGVEKLGQVISHTCQLAQYLKQRIDETPELELLAPVALNIVCFRYRCKDADRVNANLVAELQESGICAPSTTTGNGNLDIRVAIVEGEFAVCGCGGCTVN